MEVKLLQTLLKQSQAKLAEIDGWEEIRKDYIEERSAEYGVLPIKEGIAKMISEQNFKERSKYHSSDERGLHVEVGDIAYIDFGDAYINEVGFQHFAIIVSIYHGKAFVVPMSSNASTYAQAYDVLNPHGKRHLMRIGLIPGLIKESVLFLNDAKFINTARIIEVKAHVDYHSELFKTIKDRLFQCMNIDGE